MNKTIDELKPVPCGCGGEAMLLVDMHYFSMMCKKCGISTENYDTEAEAITAWNRAMGAEKILPDNICQLCAAFDKQRNYCNLHGIWIPSDFFCKAFEPYCEDEEE